MIILGLNAFHADSAAALVIDGRLQAAVEEERFRRIKHWAGFPSQAIEWCLESAGVKLADVDIVAMNTDPRAGRLARAAYAIRHMPSPAMVLDRLRARRKRMSIEQHLAAAFPGQAFKAQIRPIEHHLAHLASAYYPSGFNRAVALSVDGFGDFASAAWGVGIGGRIAVDGKVGFPHSLGVFYQALTQFLGFPHYGDEYKVMGLAPYGKPLHVEALRKVVQPASRGIGFTLDTRYFRHHRERIAYDWEDGSPSFDRLYSRELEALLGPAREPAAPLEQRHKDLARSVQAVFEDCYLKMIDALAGEYDTDALVVAGGCAQNSVANGLIAAQTPFKRVYVAPAGYDAGGAVGAAYAAAAKVGEVTVAERSPYLGPEYSEAEIRTELATSQPQIDAAGCAVRHFADDESMIADAADRIAAGQVVGWFQGRLEWGPRALGNRSILGDPRRADMKDIINSKIKRRESFRPFAPSILREHVAEWFAQDGDVPYMAMVFPIRPDKRELIPAVTHVDGTGRLQTVDAEMNPLYAALIRAVAARTGVPIVLNTSFNENEPVVCRPVEALQCMLRTEMDVVYLGRFAVSRDAGMPS
ncbi:MAG: carbamoyltransferase [Lysobacterales bacterium]